VTKRCILYDCTSGTLVKGTVWLADWFSSQVAKPLNHYYGRPTAGDKEDEVDEVRNCNVDPRHVTKRTWRRIVLDLFGGPIVTDFLPIGVPHAIVSTSFIERLRQTELTGYKIESIVAFDNNSTRLKESDLHYLKFDGSAGCETRLKVVGAANLCPHCMMTTMVCPRCGERNWPKCINCDKWTLFLPKAPEYSSPKGFPVEGYPPDVQVVEGKLWDQKDFFTAAGVAFVSNRAKEWMERTHTHPIEFKPALLNIEGVEEKFKGK
jgi:hypothetical protein